MLSEVFLGVLVYLERCSSFSVVIAGVANSVVAADFAKNLLWLKTSQLVCFIFLIRHTCSHAVTGVNFAGVYFSHIADIC